MTDASIQHWEDVKEWIGAEMDTDGALNQCKSTLRHFFDFCERKDIEDVSEVQKEDIRHYVKVLRSNYTEVSTYNMWRHLDAYFSALRGLGALDENVLEVAKEEYPGDIKPQDWSTANPQKVQENGETVIELDNGKIDQMVRACDTVRDKLIIRLLQDTGLRASELCSVSVEQVKDGWDKNTITDVVTAKRDGSTRDVYYTDRTSVLLTEYLEGGGRSRYTPADESPYLIVSLRSEQMHPNWLNRIVRNAADEAEVQEVMWTDAKDDPRYRYTAQHFRSNFAIKFVDAEYGGGSGSLEMLRRMLGHADLETTRDAYLGFAGEQVRQSYNRYYK